MLYLNFSYPFFLKNDWRSQAFGGSLFFYTAALNTNEHSERISHMDWLIEQQIACAGFSWISDTIHLHDKRDVTGVKGRNGEQAESIGGTVDLHSALKPVRKCVWERKTEGDVKRETDKEVERETLPWGLTYFTNERNEHCFVLRWYTALYTHTDLHPTTHTKDRLNQIWKPFIWPKY